jgi:hypothetical protein
VEAWASDSNFNRRKAHGNSGNFLAVCQPVLYMELNGILDVLDGFFIGIALAVATLKRWAGNEKPSASASITMGRVMFFIT